MNKTTLVLAAAAVMLLGSCAAVPSGPDLDKLAAAIVKASFRGEKLVGVDRLEQAL